MQEKQLKTQLKDLGFTHTFIPSAQKAKVRGLPQVLGQRAYLKKQKAGEMAQRVEELATNSDMSSIPLRV